MSWYLPHAEAKSKTGCCSKLILSNNHKIAIEDKRSNSKGNKDCDYYEIY